MSEIKTRKRAGVKVSLVLLSLLLFLLIFAPVAAAAIYGDINDDGDVDVQDVVLAMKHALGLELLTGTEKSVADVNGDGDVDVQDVTLIMQRSLRLIDDFPSRNIEVLSINVINLKEVEVEFNQPMDPLSAQNPANYVFSGFTATNLNAAAVSAQFTDSTNTTVRLVTAGLAATDRMATTDTAAKLKISNVKNRSLAETYSSPAAREAVGTIAADTTNPTVASITPLGTNHFMVTYSEAVIGSNSAVNNSALKESAYKVGTTELSDSVAAKKVVITNPSGDLRNFLFAFEDAAVDVVPLIGSRTIWVNNHAIANNKVQDYAGNVVPITSNAVTFVQDLTRPTVEKVELVDRQTARVTFSEMVQDPANIALIRWGTDTYAAATKTAATFTYRFGNTYDIGFTAANAMPESGAFKLFIPKEQVVDLSGNVMLSDYVGNLTGMSAATMQISASGTTTQVTITFSRAIANDSTITNPANYKIDGAALPAGVTPVRLSNTQVRITTPLTNGSHTVAISSLKDSFGVTIPDLTATFSVTDTTSPTILGFWHADGVTVAGATKDVLLVQFSIPMDPTTLQDTTNYKAIAAGGSVIGSLGDFPGGTTATPLGGNRVVRITTLESFLPRVAWNTDDFHFGRLVGASYKGVLSSAGNILAPADWINNLPIVRADLGIASFTGVITSHNTVTLTESVANNAVGSASIADFTAKKNSTTDISIINIAVGESAAVNTGLNDKITMTFADGTFSAGDTVDITLTASNSTTDAFGVNITGGTEAVNTNTIGAAITSVAVLDSTKIVVVFDKNIKVGQADALKESLLVSQGGTNKAISSVAQVNLSVASTNNRQFVVTLSNSIDPLQNVLVKTKSPLLISAQDEGDNFIRADETGIASKGFAAATAVFTNGSGSAPTITDLAATDDVVIRFNRAVNPNSIKAGWDGTATPATVTFTAANNTMVIQGVGTFVLNAVAVNDTITPNMTYNAVTRTLTIPMTDIAAGTNANATTFTYTPAAGIRDALANAIDATHVIAR
jgi:hypothetical protein